MKLKNMIFEEFGSINALIKSFYDRGVNEVYRGERCFSKTGGESFTRTESFDHAMELLTGGWDEPLSQMKTQTARHIVTNTTSHRARPENAVIGYTPNVPNAILGLPDSMINTTRVPQKVRAVTLIYTITVNCGYNQDDIYKAGLCFLNVVNSLEIQGYRVKVLVEPFCGHQEREEHVCFRVNVKDWRQPLDLKKLAFPLSHPSMFRRIGFRWLETTPKLNRRGWIRGYGQAFTNDYEDIQGLKKFYEKHELLKNGEYIISASHCIANKFDLANIMEASGVAQLIDK